MLVTAMNVVQIMGCGNEVKPLKVEVMINQQKVEMEIDTGAAVTLVNKLLSMHYGLNKRPLDCVGHKYNYGHIQENH